MRLVCGYSWRKFTGLVIIILLLVNTFLAAFMVESVSAAPFQSKLTLKWSTSVGSNGRTQGGPLVADINGDGKMEVVVTGAVVTSTGWTSTGSISCLDAVTGKILWKDDGTNITNIGVDPRTPFDFADLLGNGKLEIVVYSYSGPLVLFPNGTVYWRRMDVTADANYGAIADVNGDGHPEIFTCGGETPFMTSGTDHMAELTYDGKLLHETPSWHPCFGGLSIADIDGHWILFEGDRSASYSGDNDSQKGGGWGVRALDAQTLTPLWNDSDILCSSQCPVLANVTGQGQLEVVIAMQTNKGFAVLNATNGSVITDYTYPNGTSGYIYRKGAAGQGLSSHSQLTVGDFDGDGHLEAVVDGQGTPAKIWDLYDWKLDAVLPITCWEPPGAGYVTADGKLDLVAVNASGKDIHIYSFDKNANAYVEVDNITTGIDGANAFTVVQDVDGDGLNELFVSSYNGRVYCYDTPGPTPYPKPRSGLQFYSEYKRRVAEYVLPAGSQGLVISNPSPGDKGSNIPITLSQLSFSLTDLQQKKMNYTVITSPDIGSGSGTNKLDGIYSISVSNLSYNTTYTWTVTATDGQNSASSTFTFQTASGSGSAFIFSDGFEGGNFNAWTGTSGTPQVVSTKQNEGSYSALFNPKGAYEYCYKNLPSAQSTIYDKCYFLTDELPKSSTYKYDIMRGYAGGNMIFQVAILNNSGSLEWSFNYRSGTTWTEVDSSPTTISTNTWYCVELYWKQSATGGEVHLYINGVDVASVTGKNTNSYGPCDTIRNGVSSYSGTFTGPNVYEDSVAVNNAYISP